MATETAYDDLPGIRWSVLSRMDDSPLAFNHALHLRNQDTEAMAVGRATHHAVLTPRCYAREIVVWDGGTKRGKAWEEFRQVNAGKTILRQDQHEMALAMRDAVRSNPVARRYLVGHGGQAERVVRWTDLETRLLCKAKIDYLVTPRWLGQPVIVDLKTAIYSDARRFASSVARYRYHGQMAYYRMGLRSRGINVNRVVLIVVEKAPPYDVSVFRLSEDALGLGEAMAQGLLARVNECHGQGRWPGRYDEEIELDLPGWAYMDPDSDDEEDSESFDSFTQPETNHA